MTQPDTTVDLTTNPSQRGRLPDGRVRWEHVTVTYVETHTKTVRVCVAAAEPLTQADLDANGGYLVDLAVAVNRHSPHAHYKAPTTTFRGAKTAGSEVAGR